MDKYYYFMRAFLRNTLEYLYKHKYPKKTMASLVEGLKSIWNDDGSSYEIILHLCDIWLTEIFRACGSVAPNDLLLAMLEVFIHYYKYADHASIEKRIQARVFNAIFESHFPERPAIVPDMAKDKETYPDIYFSNLNLESVAALLLQHASDKGEFYHRNGLFKAHSQCLIRQRSGVEDMPVKKARHSKSEAVAHQRKQQEDYLDDMADYYLQRRLEDRQKRDAEEGLDEEDDIDAADQMEDDNDESNSKGEILQADEGDVESEKVDNMEEVTNNDSAAAAKPKKKKNNKGRKAKESATSVDSEETNTTPTSSDDTTTAAATTSAASNDKRKRKRKNNKKSDTNGSAAATTTSQKQPLEEIEAKVADVPLDEIALNHTPGHHASFSHDMHKSKESEDKSAVTSSNNGSSKKPKPAKGKETTTTTDEPATPPARKSVRWAKNQVKEFSSEVTPTTPKATPASGSKLKGLLTRKDSPAPRRPTGKKNVLHTGL
eukprot:TRINITY_DN1057_c2_g1_i2.p1 TRINITY_DN1057_c2_g1~~TRINITY_DN1057_c2_g1_i2.p1  ORF type:complete len:490 (-),score=134.88 TRINITY_DN1057_c2_g1_i2:12-1481(-)